MVNTLTKADTRRKCGFPQGIRDREGLNHLKSGELKRRDWKGAEKSKLRVEPRTTRQNVRMVFARFLCGLRASAFQFSGLL